MWQLLVKITKIDNSPIASFVIGMLQLSPNRLFKIDASYGSLDIAKDKEGLENALKAQTYYRCFYGCPEDG